MDSTSAFFLFLIDAALLSDTLVCINYAVAHMTLKSCLTLKE